VEEVCGLELIGQNVFCLLIDQQLLQHPTTKTIKLQLHVVCSTMETNGDTGVERTNLYDGMSHSDQRMSTTTDTGVSGVKTTVNALLGELEEKPSEFEVFEGSLSGSIYVETGGDMLRAEVTETGLSAIPTPTIDEELNPLAHIEPGDDETVEDAVDSITFAGD